MRLLPAIRGFVTSAILWTGAGIAADYFPRPETEGGWRTLVPANREPSAEQKAAVRRVAGVDALVIIPSLDLVVVRLGPMRELNAEPDFYTGLFSRIMAAVMDRP